MNTSKRTPRASTAKTPRAATSTTSSGTQRVYVDLPADSVRRFNVLAAMRSMPKRALLTQIVEEALKAAKL